MFWLSFFCCCCRNNDIKIFSVCINAVCRLHYILVVYEYCRWANVTGAPNIYLYIYILVLVHILNVHPHRLFTHETCAFVAVCSCTELFYPIRMMVILTLQQKKTETNVLSDSMSRFGVITFLFWTREHVAIACVHRQQIIKQFPVEMPFSDDEVKTVHADTAEAHIYKHINTRTVRHPHNAQLTAVSIAEH